MSACVKRVNLVGSAIGNAGNERFVRDCFSLSPTKVRDVTGDHHDAQFLGTGFRLEGLDNDGYGFTAPVSRKNFDVNSGASFSGAINDTTVSAFHMPEHLAASPSQSRPVTL
jgi:hypothetical protein